MPRRRCALPRPDQYTLRQFRPVVQSHVWVHYMECVAPADTPSEHHSAPHSKHWDGQGSAIARYHRMTLTAGHTRRPLLSTRICLRTKGLVLLHARSASAECWYPRVGDECDDAGYGGVCSGVHRVHVSSDGAARPGGRHAQPRCCPSSPHSYARPDSQVQPSVRGSCDIACAVAHSKEHKAIIIITTPNKHALLH